MSYILFLITAFDLTPRSQCSCESWSVVVSRTAWLALTLLSHAGYLPRSGITTVAEAVNASNWVFNMGRDVATYLSTLQVSFSGNLDTETFSIGGEDKRTYSPTGIGSLAAGRQWGTDTHARVECDNSPTREDFDLNKG